MDSYILTIDQGTTGTTVLLINHQGKVHSRGYYEITQYYPQPGWVEHDAEEIWHVTQRAIRDAIISGNISVKQITAIGITNQRETTVIWDRKTGNPIHRAIVWQCRRTAHLCEQLKKRGLEKSIRNKTGLVIDAYFSGTKIKWYLDNLQGIKQRAKRGELAIGTIDSWLVWNLTGGKSHVTDFTNASRTMLFNINKLKWDDEILNELQIPHQLLPEVKPSSGLFGITEHSNQIPSGIPITGIAGDQQAALFGQTCFEPGSAKNTYGTGCFLLFNTGKKKINSKHGLLTTLACGPKGEPIYALEGSVFITGAAIQWLRDGLQIISTASETESLAKSVPDNLGVYIVPAFVGLGAPYWDMHARGIISGLTRGVTRAHIARATLESIAYQTKDLLDAITNDSKIKLKSLKVDGGATQNNFLMQFQADILGIPVDRPKNIETTATGAAFLAGLGSGFWSDSKDLINCREHDRLFKPKMNPSKRKQLYSGWQQAIHKTLSQ